MVFSHLISFNWVKTARGLWHRTQLEREKKVLVFGPCFCHLSFYDHLSFPFPLLNLQTSTLSPAPAPAPNLHPPPPSHAAQTARRSSWWHPGTKRTLELESSLSVSASSAFGPFILRSKWRLWLTPPPQKHLPTLEKPTHLMSLSISQGKEHTRGWNIHSESQVWAIRQNTTTEHKVSFFQWFSGADFSHSQIWIDAHSFLFQLKLFFSLQGAFIFFF